MVNFENLKDCFESDFTIWLLSSNNPKVGPYLSEDRFVNMRNRVECESLMEILDVLIREPEADYFWYTYKEHGGGLIYALPHHDTVHSNSIRVNKEKVRIFIRDCKLQKLLD
jgi:hypothetical protein